MPPENWYRRSVCRHFLLLLTLLLVGNVPPAPGQTNFGVLTPDGGWTWYNDPRAVYHNGILYFGYVRKDGETALNAFNPRTGVSTLLWESVLTQRDDHNNPGLLVKEDGAMLAIYARHGSDRFFAYRNSISPNPISPSDWGAEQRIPDSGAGLTYANPYQLSAEQGRIYNFARNQNLNPTVFTSPDGGSTWSPPQLMIRTGTGGVRPYVKYASDYQSRIEFLYTDGHPRDVNNSLFHLYYQGGAFYRSDGTLVRSFDSLPILHDAGERGSVIYQYSDASSTDPNDHIAGGRAWCWEIIHQAGGLPVALFTVQKDQVTGTTWSDARIYYYYARWTGTNWQKRLIAHAGRPLYTPEDDYAGGICADPNDPSVVYISSNAADPFHFSSITDVPLRENARYELWRGSTPDAGLTFSWTQVTSNSAVDNLRPYIPRGQTGTPAVIWFRGSYPSFTSFDCQVVGLFPQPLPQPPELKILSPKGNIVIMTNLANTLRLDATVSDDGIPGPLAVAWSTISGPASAQFESSTSACTSVVFPSVGLYQLRLTASDGLNTVSNDVVVQAGILPSSGGADPQQSLWFKFDESSGSYANDSSDVGNTGSVSGLADWRLSGGRRDGALSFDGTSTVVTVPDSPSLDDAGALSIAFWFFAGSYPADSAGLVCKRDGPSTENAYTTYLKAANRLLYVDIDGSDNRFSSASQINLGEWYHVAVVFDGSKPSSSRVSLYLNGALDVTAAENSSVVADHTSALRIGNTHAGAAYWFNGLIDDVRIYRRTLEPAEIRLLAATNSAPSVTIAAIPALRSGIPAVLSGSAVDDGQGGGLAVKWEQVAGRPALLANTNLAQAQATFTKAGSYSLRFSATDSQAEVSQAISLAVAPNTNVFADWMDTFYPSVSDEQVVGSGADPDRDTVPNLVEFALGMNPKSSSTGQFTAENPGLPKAEIRRYDGTNFLVMAVRRPAGLLGISYGAAGTAELLAAPSTWSPCPILPNAEDVRDGRETVFFRDLVPSDPSIMRFMQLRVQAGW